jgi:hypothetical protein
VDASALGPHVNAMQVHHALQSQLSEPGIKRQGLVPQVTLKFLVRLGQRVLNHIGGIDTSRESPIHAERYQLFEPRAVALPEPAARRSVSVSDLLKQAVSVVGSLGGH